MSTEALAPLALDWVGQNLVIKSGLSLVVTRFQVDEILEQPAARFTVELVGAVAFQSARAGQRFSLQVGLVQDGVPELLDLIRDGIVDYYTLKAEQPQGGGAATLTVELQGRDAMARLLDTEFNLTYRNGPTPQVTDGSIQVPEVNGLFMASDIARHIASAAGLDLFWEAPDYAVHDSFSAVGRPYDLIQNLVRPFSLLDAVKVDVFTIGTTLFVRQRRPLAMRAGPLTTFSVRDARVASVQDRKFRTNPIGLLGLQGMRTDGAASGDGGATAGAISKVPVLSWDPPPPITWPTALSGAQLNARADVAGSFTYSPSEGTSPDPGSVTLEADFAPDDPSVKAGRITVTLEVDKIASIVVWATPGSIAEGTALGDDQLNATATDADGHPLAGSFTYRPGAGIVLTAGSHELTVEFHPSESTHYDVSTGSVTLEVTGVAPPKTPVITWVDPDPIVVGQALSGTQLNAVATDPGTGDPVAGSFAYTPASGAVLSAGTKTLKAVFTPEDTGTYQTVTASTSILVERIVITWAPDPLLVGSALGTSQLNASANVPGDFDYSANPLGTVETEIGLVELMTTFTPTAEGPAPVAHSVALRVIDATGAFTDPGSQYAMRTVTISDTASGPQGSVTTESTYWMPGNLLLTEKSSTWAPTPGTQLPGMQLGGFLKLMQRTLSWQDPIPGPNGLLNQPRQLSEVKEEASCSADGQQLAYTRTEITYVYDDPLVDPRGLLNLETELVHAFTLAASEGDAGAPVLNADGTLATDSMGFPISDVPVGGDGKPLPGYVNLLAGGPGALVLTAMPTGLPAKPSKLMIKRYRDHGPDFYSISTESYRWNPLGGPFTPDLTQAGTGFANIPGTSTGPRGQWEFDPQASDASIAPGTRPGGVNSGGGALSADALSGDRTSLVPQIGWSPPADMTWGDALGEDQLNATADVEGTFSFSPPAGVILNPGTVTLTALFRPADPAWKTVTATVTVRVLKKTPVITWNTPADIASPTPLSGTQLNATADVPGNFAYNPAAGAVLNPGTHTLHVTFTPDDAAHIAPATATVTLIVTGSSSAIAPTITWDAPDALTEGLPLSATQLAATVTDPTSGDPVPGTLVYSPPLGTVLAPGSHPLYVTFTPTDTGTYKTVSDSVTLTVTKIEITWSKPGDVTVGTALDDSQLDASANVEGAFVYTPPAGTIMGSVGTVTLAATFTPADGGTVVLKTVSLRVVADASGATGMAGTGPYVTIQRQVDPDPTAPPISLSDPNLDQATLELIAQQLAAASGLWQHEIQFSGPGVPSWLRRGDVAQLTEFRDETGQLVTLPPFLVQQATTEYNQAGLISRRTVHGLAWTRDPA